MTRLKVCKDPVYSAKLKPRSNTQKMLNEINVLFNVFITIWVMTEIFAYTQIVLNWTLYNNKLFIRHLISIYK